MAHWTMLHTDIVSDLMKNPGGKAATRLAAEGEGSVCISIISAAELRFGAAKNGSSKLLSRVEAILAEFDVLPLDEPADARYSILRMELELAGNTITPHDLLIAAHALAVDATLATTNVSQFSRVSGLRVENWLA